MDKPETVEQHVKQEPQNQKCRNQNCNCTGNNKSKELTYVYALGKVECHFPNQAVEKECAQVLAQSEVSGLTDHQAMHKVLSQRQNRYITRQLCWTLSIEGLNTYLLQPRDPSDFDLLVESIRPAPSPMDLDVVIGLLGPIATPSMCNGLMLPIVFFDQIYSFDRESLIQSIPKPKIESTEQENLFKAASEELLDRVMQLADNAGATDEHRALNYLIMRYPGIYAKLIEAYTNNNSLTSVEVYPSRLSNTRKIVSPVLSFTNRSTQTVEKYFVRVDVTEEFPFLLTKLSPYYDR